MGTGQGRAAPNQKLTFSAKKRPKSIVKGKKIGLRHTQRPVADSAESEQA